MATARHKSATPEFVEESPVDPVAVATGRSPVANAAARGKEKKKAGYYLSVEVLERFTRKFHELKLSGIPIENKSALVEMALTFALEDLDKGGRSKLLKKL